MEQSHKISHSHYNEILLIAQTFFQDKGFERTTVWDICSSLQISTAQFFSFFDSLDDVLEILWVGKTNKQHDI